MFSGKLAGTALLLLRATVSFTLFMQGKNYLARGFDTTVLNWLIGLVSIISGGALLIGIFTRIFSSLVFLGALLKMTALFSTFVDDFTPFDLSAAYVGLIAVSIFLMGPGEFSLDARLFGRREIIIPQNTFPPKP